MTQPEVGFNAPEADQTYSKTQDTLDDHTQAIPPHDPSGIDDDDISSALRSHNDKTKANIGDAHKSLNDGKTAVRGLDDTDADSAARGRRIDPSSVAVLRDALQRSQMPAPAAAPQPQMMPAQAMPAPAPVSMPMMSPGPTITADALARLLANAQFSPTSHAQKTGDHTRGVSVSAIPFDASNPKASMQSYLVAKGTQLGLNPTEIGMAWAVGQHETQWSEPGFMGFGPEAKAAGYNLDGDPRAAIDQYYKQYIDRLPSGLNRDDPAAIASYIHRTVHNAADPNYTQELIAAYPGPLTWNGKT